MILYDKLKVHPRVFWTGLVLFLLGNKLGGTALGEVLAWIGLVLVYFRATILFWIE